MVPGQSYLVNQSGLAQGEAASHTETILSVFLSLCTRKATYKPVVSACAGDTVAHRVLTPLQHNFHGPGEAAPLRCWKMGQGDQLPKRYGKPYLGPYICFFTIPLPFPKTSFRLSYQKSQPSDCLPPILSKGSFQHRLLSTICPCLKTSLGLHRSGPKSSVFPWKPRRKGAN